MTHAESLVRGYIERVWNQGDATALGELTAPGFKYNLGGQPARDRSGFEEFLAAMRQAFPDWRVQIDQVVVGTEAVAVRWHGQVTHEGSFRGIAPTGRTIRVVGINVYTIEDGLIATEWEQTDSLGMLQQIGVLPAS